MSAPWPYELCHAYTNQSLELQKVKAERDKLKAERDTLRCDYNHLKRGGKGGRGGGRGGGCGGWRGDDEFPAQFVALDRYEELSRQNDELRDQNDELYDDYQRAEDENDRLCKEAASRVLLCNWLRNKAKKAFEAGRSDLAGQQQYHDKLQRQVDEQKAEIEVAKLSLTCVRNQYDLIRAKQPALKTDLEDDSSDDDDKFVKVAPAPSDEWGVVDSGEFD